MPPPSDPAVRSPCVSICRLDETASLCIGCWRTIEEIAAWGQLSDDEKRAVLGRLPQRRARAPR